MEANRQQDFNTEIANLDKWVEEIHNSLQDKETGTDITTTRALHNKHKVILLSCSEYTVFRDYFKNSLLKLDQFKPIN